MTCVSIDDQLISLAIIGFATADPDQGHRLPNVQLMDVIEHNSHQVQEKPTKSKIIPLGLIVEEEEPEVLTRHHYKSPYGGYGGYGGYAGYGGYDPYEQYGYGEYSVSYPQYTYGSYSNYYESD